MRWRARVILQLGARSRLHACTAKGVLVLAEDARRHVPEHRRRPHFSTFMAGKHAKVSPAAEPQSFTEVECLGSQPLGMVSRLLRQPLYGFVVESQSPLRLDTSASWRRCLFSLGGGPLARAKLQRYPLSYARLAHTLKIRLKKTWPCREGSRDIGTFHASSPKAQADLAGNQKES